MQGWLSLALFKRSERFLQGPAGTGGHLIVDDGSVEKEIQSRGMVANDLATLLKLFEDAVDHIRSDETIELL